ncbi:MAG: MerR family transcriptional regulator [Fibrobacterota bacterium]|nr:MerR family transcriptional regulator [Chitinispirillaceae bacterium]
MIQKKLYYSISEVCTMTGLEQHVLRYWESEFPQLKPKKNRAGNRAYREKDIDIINYIKNLLYEEKFTITGAKKKLAESKVPVDSDESAAEPISQTELDFNKPVTMTDIRNELIAILELLNCKSVPIENN